MDLIEIQTNPSYNLFLVTCNIKEDPIKTKGARVLTSFDVRFLDAQRAANSAVSGRIPS